jgi:hypothetical protein
MQVYLPDDLHREVKRRRLPASELLQAAVRAAMKRQDILAEGDRYLEELIAKVGMPTEAEIAAAEARIFGNKRRAKRAG